MNISVICVNFALAFVAFYPVLTITSFTRLTRFNMMLTVDASTVVYLIENPEIICRVGEMVILLVHSA